MDASIKVFQAQLSNATHLHIDTSAMEEYMPADPSITIQDMHYRSPMHVYVDVSIVEERKSKNTNWWGHEI